MKKILFIILILLLTFGIGFGVVISIKDIHDEGIFVEFSSIGYAWQSSEISTQPLLDIVGAFNLKYRFYLGKFSVFNFENFLVDPLFVGKVYMQQNITPNDQIYLFLSKNYNFTNFFVGKFSFKTYFEVMTPGVFNNTSFSLGIIPRVLIGTGMYFAENIEWFVSIEGGMVYDIITSEIVDENWKQYINELRTNSLYSTVKVGLNWYYDNYSGIEIGYRFLIYGKNSYLRFIQGVSITDIIYNLVNLAYVSNEDEKINIPFITTDYYLSFSTKF
ncbi:hypothetical protein [Thermosipho melanesiensis]|uniref:Uncharacterized protein n=2 Tax=Thermosipho melanesiensis TaxID=46541 RepID=A6LNI3_THEM4|nr:hypothetical protein [Thermosipho melanesiensis]ABR31484.1 hypothetical protein Tmel_1640 [Thermosipho melanesiensis BI429]